MLALTSVLSFAAATTQDGLYSESSPVTSLTAAGVPAHNSTDQLFMLVVRRCGLMAVHRVADRDCVGPKC